MADELTPLNDKLEPETELLPYRRSEATQSWIDASVVSAAISLKRIADMLERVITTEGQYGPSIRVERPDNQ